jgi:hypothetical protein
MRRYDRLGINYSSSLDLTFLLGILALRRLSGEAGVVESRDVSWGWTMFDHAVLVQE